nr:RNA-directed DNA polymerase, eukaryota, reverse transcriptase zinc-binding domain protein [Tanacetum cinerariifolium]
MSKLDRFLVSEGLHYMFPSLSALCLDKNLSDHRPILMRELSTDYGPTSFCIFHSWFSLEGFDNLVKESWSKPVLDEKNSMDRLKKKFQNLKANIKMWRKEGNRSKNDIKASIQKELSNLDKIIDQGMCQEETLADRTKLQLRLHDLNSLISQEMAQKAKVRWAIEGDENSKFFHGVINKKRPQLAIRGVLVDEEWISETVKVDFEKAFDSIRWDYLDEVLLNFGFGSKWRGWINGCLSSSMGSVLVNGSPTTEFKFYKGSKQGDPLSPFLFILVMESLHLAFTNVLNAGIFKGGLKINIHKSKLMGVGLSKEEVDSAASKLMGVGLSKEEVDSAA